MKTTRKSKMMWVNGLMAAAAVGALILQSADQLRIPSHVVLWIGVVVTSINMILRRFFTKEELRGKKQVKKDSGGVET